ncbi:MAG: hypothetical protein V2B18_15730 [Pseudomonadota bacterium]
MIPPPLAPPPESAYCPPAEPSFIEGISQLLPLPVFGLGTVCQDVVLPRVGCRQFEVTARLWQPRLNSNTLLWGTQPGGIPGTEIDIQRDLNLGKKLLVAEYEGRCQIRSNWGIRYAFMPIKTDEVTNVALPTGFWFGYAPYFFAENIYTKWERNVHKWDIEYDWFQAKHAVASLHGGYSLYDDRISIQSRSAPKWRTRSRTLGLAHAGVGVQRVIRQVGGGTASINCKWSMQFLDGYVGWDGSALGRVAVNMGSGRWGFMEAGWRWVVLERERPSDKDKISMDGVIGSLGFIF